MARYDVESLKRDIQSGIDGALQGAGHGTRTFFEGLQAGVSALRSDVGRTITTVVQIALLLRREFPQIGRTLTGLQQRVQGEIQKTFNFVRDKFRGIERDVTKNLRAVDKLTKDFQKKPGEIVKNFEKFATQRAKEVTKNVDAVRKGVDDARKMVQRFPSDLQKAGTTISRNTIGSIQKELGRLPNQFQNAIKGGVSLLPRDQQKIVSDLDRLFKQTSKQSGSEISRQLAGYGDGLKSLKNISGSWDEVAKAAKAFSRIFGTLSKILPILSDFLNGLQINSIEDTVERNEKKLNRIESVLEQAQIKIRLDAISANLRANSGAAAGGASNGDVLRAISNLRYEVLTRLDGGGVGGRQGLTAADLSNIQSAVQRALSTVPGLGGGLTAADVSHVQAAVQRAVDPKFSALSDKVGLVGGHVLTAQNMIQNFKVPEIQGLGDLRTGISGLNQSLGALPERILGPFNSGISGVNAKIDGLSAKLQSQAVDLYPLERLLSGQTQQLNRGFSDMQGTLGALVIQGNGHTGQLNSITGALNGLRSAPAPTINYTPPPITVNPTPVNIDLMPMVSAINGLYNPIQLTYNQAAEAVRIGQLNYNRISGLQIPQVNSAAIVNGVVGQLNPKIDQIKGIGDKTYELVGGDALKNGMPTQLPDVVPTAVTTLAGLTLAGAALSRFNSSGLTSKIDSIKTTVELNGSKLGEVLPSGGLSGWVNRFNKRFDFSAVTNSLTLIVSLHNAAMLSQNLGQTLGDVASQGLAAIGIKDDGGSPIDVNAILGKQVNSFFESLLGAEVWNGTKTAWKKANRIITSATSIVWTIRSIADSARDIQEWTASSLGKLMNAHKKNRVVSENSYPWQSENVRNKGRFARTIDKYRQGIENLDDAASSLSMVTGNVLDIQSEFGELQEQKTEFEKQLREGLSLVGQQNQPLATKATATTVNSRAAAPPAPADLLPSED